MAAAMLSFVRPIGLIGGMSWESTSLYYQLINRGVARRLGAVAVEWIASG